jgi:hypothetical protein
MNCRETDKRHCRPAHVPPARGTPFGVCLPFGASLEYDGHALFYRPPAEVPQDGDWLVRVRDGCLAWVAMPPAPLYVAPPCQPEPYPCAGDGAGGAALSPSADNLSRLDQAGAILTELFAEGEGVTGKGTAQNPLKISVPAQGLFLQAGTDTPKALGVSGAGTETSPLMISHQPTTAASAGNLSIDAYGHVTGIAEATGAGTGISKISSPDGHIDVAGEDGPGTVLSLPTLHGTEREVAAFSHDLVIDLQGRVRSVAPKVPLAVSERFFRAFETGLASISFPFQTVAAGRVRATLRGNLVTTLANAGGLAAAPSTFAASLDGTPLTILAATENGVISVLEILGEYSFNPGDHVLSVSWPSPATGPLLLDVGLCQ